MGLYFPYQICPHCGKKCSKEEESVAQVISESTTQVPEGYRCNKCNEIISSHAMQKQNEELEEKLVKVLLEPKHGALANMVEASKTLGKIGSKDKTVAALFLAAIFGAKEKFGAEIRDAAVKALSEIGKRDGSVRVFITLQLAGNESRDRDVRTIIVDTLGNIGDSRDVDVLIAFLKDEDQCVHEKTVEAILKMPTSVVEPLITVLGDEVWRVREGAATALGEIGDKRAVEPLLAALRDKHEQVQAAAALALGGLDDQRVVEPLIAALRDGKKVGEAAARALTKVTGKRFLFDNMNAEKWERWWEQNK